MINDNELIFTDLIEDLPDKLEKLGNLINEFNNEIDKSMFYSNTDELSHLINEKISKQLNNLNNEFNNCQNFLSQYLENLKVLNSGLLTNEFSVISEFNEAKNLINNDFR